MIIVFFILTNYYCKELISHQIEILIDHRSRFEQKRFEIFHHHICFIVDPWFGSGCGGEINSCRVCLVIVLFIKKMYLNRLCNFIDVRRCHLFPFCL